MNEEFIVVDIERYSIVASLRTLARILRDNDDYVLIGLWNTPPSRESTEGCLQVVLGVLQSENISEET